MAVRAVRPGTGASDRRLRRLRRAELPHDTATLARWLIGKTLVRDSDEGRSSGRIVETEAYVVGDASGHAYVGETDRNRSLFLRRGHAYVYFIYGMHYCVNVSGGAAGRGRRRPLARARTDRRYRHHAKAAQDVIASTISRAARAGWREAMAIDRGAATESIFARGARCGSPTACASRERSQVGADRHQQGDRAAPALLRDRATRTSAGRRRCGSRTTLPRRRRRANRPSASCDPRSRSSP